MAVAGLISVLITTHRAPDYLAVSLSSFKRQSDRGFEIVVAEDGSDDKTRDVIDAARRTAALPIVYVKQDHIGFRAARLRNIGIKKCRGDYTVFVDGDCFVFPDFVERHRTLAERGKFVSGKRSYLRPNISNRILAAATAPEENRARWFARACLNQCTRFAEFIPRPDGAWRYRRAMEWEGVLSCNLAAYRCDTDTVNGFDNRYEGHGLEDSDFVQRLINSGISRKLGDHGSTVLHLAHERLATSGSQNAARFAQLLKCGGYRAADGLEQADAPPEEALA